MLSKNKKKHPLSHFQCTAECSVYSHGFMRIFQSLFKQAQQKPYPVNSFPLPLLLPLPLSPASHHSAFCSCESDYPRDPHLSGIVYNLHNEKIRHFKYMNAAWYQLFENNMSGTQRNVTPISPKRLAMGRTQHHYFTKISIRMKTSWKLRHSGYSQGSQSSKIYMFCA